MLPTSNTVVTIRKAVKADAQTAHQLIRELAIFEKAAAQHTLSLADFIRDGFGEKPIYHLLVAEASETDTTGQTTKKVVGICLFYFGYSTWKGKKLYLDDLVITEAYRRLGIGQKMVNALMEIAQQEQVNHVRWHVLDWNEPAIKFYQKLNMKLEADWITCKFEKQQIADYKPL